MKETTTFFYRSNGPFSYIITLRQWYSKERKKERKQSDSILELGLYLENETKVVRVEYVVRAEELET